MTTFPVEVLERVINQFYVTQNRSPAALGPLSLSFRTANELARKLKFKTATISTYFDLIIYQEMVENAPHLFMHTKTLRVVRLTPGYGGRSVDPHFLKDLGKVLPHFTEITSLVVGGFGIRLSAFHACRNIQSVGYICVGYRIHPVRWGDFVEFLMRHKPRAIHIEDCAFSDTSDQDILRNPLPQPTTLSLLDPHDGMKWMTGISLAFPNVISLCVTPSLLPVAAGFASLRNLTLTDPHDLSNYDPLLTCNGLATLRIVFLDSRFNTPPTSFQKIHECLPPTVTLVVTVASTSEATFSLLKDFSNIALTRPGIQYHLILSPASIHEHLDPETVEEWECRYWTEDEDENGQGKIRLKESLPLVSLKEGPEEEWPFQYLEQQEEEVALLSSANLQFI